MSTRRITPPRVPHNHHGMAFDEVGGFDEGVKTEGFDDEGFETEGFDEGGGGVSGVTSVDELSSLHCRVTAALSA